MASATKNAVCRVSLDDCKKAAATKAKDPVTFAAPRGPDAPTASATGEPNGLQPQMGFRSGPIRASREGSRGTEVDWDPWTNAPKGKEQLADEAALEKRPYGKLAAKWLEQQGIEANYRDGFGSGYDEERRAIYLDISRDPVEDRVKVYEKAVVHLAGIPDKKERPDPTKMPFDEWFVKARDYDLKLYAAEARLNLQKQKLEGGSVIPDHKYQKYYTWGYKDAVESKEYKIKNSLGRPLTETEKEQFGHVGGLEQISHQIGVEMAEDLDAEWKKANPPAQRRWYCAWAWHCG